MTLAWPAAVSHSPLRAIDPRWRLVTLALAAALISCITSPTYAALAGLVCLGWARLTRTTSGLTARLVILSLLSLPLVALLPITIGIEGVNQSLGLLARVLAIGTLTHMLVVADELTNTLHAAQDIGIPSRLVGIAFLTLRYVVLLEDELTRLRRALRMRGFRNRFGKHAWRTAGAVAGTLLVRGSDRAERVGQALRCRGFVGQFHTDRPFRTTWREWLFAVAMLAPLAGLAWVGQ